MTRSEMMAALVLRGFKLPDLRPLSDAALTYATCHDPWIAGRSCKLTNAEFVQVAALFDRRHPSAEGSCPSAPVFDADEVHVSLVSGKPLALGGFDS